MEQARSEEATPRKLVRARAHGQVAASPGLTASASVLGGFVALWIAGTPLLVALHALLGTALQAVRDPSLGWAATAASLRGLAWPMAALLACPALFAWLAGFAQVGPLFASASMRADAGRIDPAAQLRELFSAQRALELGMRALQVCALLALAGYVCAGLARAVLAAPAAGTLVALHTSSSAAAQLVLRVGAAALLLGGVDLLGRRLLLARRLRMTRRELADEHKESYGPPELRARRVRLQREVAAQAELAALEAAQLLLIDHAGRALALGFNRADAAQHAPRVVAKGQGELCRRMQLAAERATIPVRFDAPLVASLFRLELSEAIPPAHYGRVAELMREAESSRARLAP